MNCKASGESVLKVIEGIDVYAPEPLGKMDVFIAGGMVVRMQRASFDLGSLDPEVIPGKGRILVPGFVDGHVHILGGGGEGGYASRTPELVLSDLARSGVTTVVGCLGTDGTTRHLAGLLAKARGLESEGVSTYVYTGSYHIPVKTLTGSVQDDLILIDKVVGVGEVAISDHRSSQPTFEEFIRIAAEARVGGMLSGKAGLVNVHVGDGPRRLEMLERAIEETEIPARHFVPTHINRSRKVLEAGIAYAGNGTEGRYIDLTTSSVRDEAVRCSQALGLLLEAGVPAQAISFSSDGQGSLPVFDEAGAYLGLGVGKVDSLFEEVRQAVLQRGIPLETAIRTITSTPASYLQLPRKGSIHPGGDADLVIL
ncbi:MAG TPA: beta-aspartyl-peptidase, partial [Holophaga sp.]|nr:beta-aspartyl-peptidase [Holophaga sp.]